MLQTKLSRLLLLVLVPVLIAGCSKGPDGPTPPKTSVVSGTVLVNGKPAPVIEYGQIELKLYPKGRDPKPGERIPKCLADKDGNFVFNSYRAGDGAVPGEYVLTMEMLRVALGGLFGPDRFGNNFNSPSSTDPRFQVTVVDDEPTVIPTIDIKLDELKQQPAHKYASPAGKRE